MSRRNYGQFCGLAHALDVVGERWTLLIVRELASGPKRYTQLAEALAGIGTSLLATRVRQLEADGVVQRKLMLDQPNAAVAYELTPSGVELAKAAVPLALWGARHQMAAASAAEETFRAEWALGFLAAVDDDELPADFAAVYQFHIDGSSAWLRVRGGRMRVTAGEATDADVTVRTTAATFLAIAGRRVTMAEAVQRGDVAVDGDPAAMTELVGIVERRLPGTAVQRA
ncbi:ArsR family transcriptional regulator [Mycolicibacterium cosmeticum]|uniref:Transcriptional regulator n=1 Tax=Mycolicibacterium cosmeticum TaxID=258533 RepID=W9B097_MYCCO|nr:winged helix-turn-helix transcriptional regulator [Mycolicibacterium cosmeticum]TLH71916.1 ArsR family transcriptional regulator [Mycolicibacterium cosmeticum]CDO08276.1 transcriptional regulator [Mycolicibacterium cosmeticum]